MSRSDNSHRLRALCSAVQFDGSGKHGKRKTILKVTRRLAGLKSRYFVVDFLGQAMDKGLVCRIDIQQIRSPGNQDGDLGNMIRLYFVCHCVIGRWMMIAEKMQQNLYGLGYKSINRSNPVYCNPAFIPLALLFGSTQSGFGY